MPAEQMDLDRIIESSVSEGAKAFGSWDVGREVAEGS